MRRPATALSLSLSLALSLSLGLFPQRAPAATAVPDPAPWEALLQSHATAGGVRYAALAGDTGDTGDTTARGQLRAYLDAVAEMPVSAPLSAWLNAYNATVVASVLAHYPLQRVTDVPGFFKSDRHRIAGAARTLDEVEHGIIRARFPDARVHAALNCGARSCPALHRHAFVESTLDATLDALSRAMVRDRRHVRPTADGKLAISSIFYWFEADFRRDYGGPIGFIRRFGGPAQAKLADTTATTELPYDWRLNAAP